MRELVRIEAPLKQVLLWDRGGEFVDRCRPIAVAKILPEPFDVVAFQRFPRLGPEYLMRDPTWGVEPIANVEKKLLVDLDDVGGEVTSWRDLVGRLSRQDASLELEPFEGMLARQLLCRRQVGIESNGPVKSLAQFSKISRSPADPVVVSAKLSAGSGFDAEYSALPAPVGGVCWVRFGEVHQAKV